MIWTKRHSQNALAAKARKRMASIEVKPEKASRVFVPRVKAKYRLQIRDLEHGDSITITLYRLPWPARYVDGDGCEYSGSMIGRGIGALLIHGS